MSTLPNNSPEPAFRPIYDDLGQVRNDEFGTWTQAMIELRAVFMKLAATGYRPTDIILLMHQCTQECSLSAANEIRQQQLANLRPAGPEVAGAGNLDADTG